MKKYLLSFIFCCFLLSKVFPKEAIFDTIKIDRSHLFCIQTGYSFHSSKDDIISPFIYSGSQAPLYIDYKYLGVKSRQTFSLFFDMVKLKSSISDLPNGLSHYTRNIYGLMDYSYNRHIYYLPKHNIRCFIGGKFNMLFNLRRHNYTSSQQEFTVEQVSSFGLNLILEKKFLTTNDFIYFNISMPLVSYSLVNDIYNAKGFITQTNELNNSTINFWQVLKNGKFITLNKFAELQSDISYTKFVGNRIGINLKYGFDFYSFAQYKRLLYSKYLNMHFLIGLTLKIK